MLGRRDRLNGMAVEVEVGPLRAHAPPDIEGQRPRVGRAEARVDAFILGQDAPQQRRAELGGLLGGAHLLLTVPYFLTIMVPCMKG
jgi:hypothetical protein